MSDTVARLNAALEGRYRIDRELGEGGMATVYLADDLRHERKVALKVLKPELAAVVGADRFLAEIKTTANLQHPHILPLFDSGEADSFLFYVMPYVEGESIRELITKEKQLGVKDALSITRKVSDALDYAHEHGVVHRDIKPGNVLLSERGEPLVADFGIALAVAQAGGGRITETGLSLGTPHYMSPEQATGDRDVDARSDVYALGCVLYEMLSGRPPFSASTAQGVLVQILTTDPPSITGLRRTVPLHVEGVLARALEKLPADRFKSAAEFTRALDDETFVYAPRPMATDPGRPAVQAPAPVQEVAAPKKGRDFRLIAAVGVAAVMTGIAAWGWMQPEPEAVTLRVTTSDPTITFPPGSGERLAISHDGSMIAIATAEGGIDRLAIRRADERDFRVIPDTDGATTPTFSPNGDWIAFSADGEIRRVEVEGGPVLPITEGINSHWGTDDKLIVNTSGGHLYQVSAAGGNPELILENVGSTARPYLLPNGKAVIFQGLGDFDDRNLMVVDIATREVTDLGIGNVNNPKYIPTGHVLYGHGDQALMAVPFDPGILETTGDPTTVLPEVLVYGGGATQFAVSQTGTVVYAVPSQTGGSSEGGLLVTVDEMGEETALPASGGFFLHPRISPNGRQIAYTGASGIFVYDLDTGENLSVIPSFMNR